jgi:hypothetical protein
VTADSYVCVLCKGRFVKGRSDAEAAEESRAIWGERDDLETVCEDCWQRIRPEHLLGVTMTPHEAALVRGAMTAARKLGVTVDREMILVVIRTSTTLEECAERLGDLLKTAGRAQGVSLEGKVSDP